METFLKIIGGATITAALLFVAPLIGVVVGAFSGWVVGLFYIDTFHTFREAIHVGPLSPWQAGAMLGFVGGFFRATLTESSKK